MRKKRIFFYCLVFFLLFVPCAIIMNLFIHDHLKLNNDMWLILPIVFFLANFLDYHSAMLAVKLTNAPEIETNPLWRTVIKKPKTFFFIRVVVPQLGLIYVPDWLVLQAPLLGSPSFLHPYWFPRVEAGLITAFCFVCFCIVIHNYLQCLKYLVFKRRWKDKLEIVGI